MSGALWQQLSRSLSSLRSRLFVLVVLALAPAFALLVYTAFEQRRLGVLEVQETALRLARLASSDHGRLIVETRQVLISLAHVPEVRSLDARGCNALFASLLPQYPLYANLGVVDASGRLFCSAVPMEDRLDLSDRAYVRRAIATREFAIGDYQMGRLTKQATINVAQPVLDEGKRVQAVVFAAIDLGSLNRFVTETKLPEGSTLTVVDHNGTVLVRYPEGEQWVGRSIRDTVLVQTILRERVGVAEAAEPDGVTSLVGFSPLFGTPTSGEVHVSIAIPSARAFDPVRQLLSRNLVILGAVGVVALLIAQVVASRFVLRPVDQLVAASRRLGAGDLTARVEGGKIGGELGELARAFDEMAAALERDRDEQERNERELAHQREALFRAERLADLGRLAAGIGHELKNPLAVVTGRVELLEQMVSRGQVSPIEPVARHVTSLREATERMRRIMHGLSTYAKPPQPTPQRLEIAPLLTATADLVAYQARTQEVDVRVDVPTGLPPIIADRSQMMQVLVNLATNAIEAMGGGTGALTLRAGSEDGAVRVEVVDTGPGMAPEILGRIWDPFFTTKPEGTGLGLSIVRALVAEQPGAQISARSVAGQGTTFAIAFRAADASPGAAADATP